MAADLTTFTTWLDQHMTQGRRNIPARLLTLLGLLERLRETPDLDIERHRAPSGAQLIEHNGFVDAALARFGVRSPVQEKGRRANNLNAWSPALFDWLRTQGFSASAEDKRHEMITAAQSLAAERLVVINEDKPLVARYNKGTAVAVIADILDQAQAKKRAKDVAEYLVGAKLEIRFGHGVVTPKNVNTPNLGQLADFRIGNTAIEVTTHERADKAHLDQIAGILQNTQLHVWLLTRLKDREKWQNAVEAVFGTLTSRVVVGDVETFLGQNMSEMGQFRIDAVQAKLAELFERYDKVWLPPTGAGGIRIISLEALGT